MKKITGIIFLISLFISSCYIPVNQEPIITTIKIEITGTNQAYIIFDSYDLGYQDLPFASEKYFQSYYISAPTTPMPDIRVIPNIYVKCYSFSPITLTIYENGVIIFNDTNNNITYNK